MNLRKANQNLLERLWKHPVLLVRQYDNQLPQMSCKYNMCTKQLTVWIPLHQDIVIWPASPYVASLRAIQKNHLAGIGLVESLPQGTLHAQNTETN